MIDLPRKACIRDFNSMLEKGELLTVKLKAIRSGVWFRALRRIDRVLVELALKVSDGIHNPIPARTSLAVVSTRSLNYSPKPFQEV